MNLAFLKGLVERYLPLIPHNSPPVTRKLIFMIRVPSEAVGLQLKPLLERQGYTDLKIWTQRAFLFKRWQLSGFSCPVKYAAPEINAWLDELDTTARSHGASLETWMPTE